MIFSKRWSVAGTVADEMLPVLTFSAKVVRAGELLKSCCRPAVSATAEKSAGIQATVQAASKAMPVISNCRHVWRKRQSARTENAARESRWRVRAFLLFTRDGFSSAIV